MPPWRLLVCRSLLLCTAMLCRAVAGAEAPASSGEDVLFLSPQTDVVNPPDAPRPLVGAEPGPTMATQRLRTPDGPSAYEPLPEPTGEPPNPEGVAAVAADLHGNRAPLFPPLPGTVGMSNDLLPAVAAQRPDEVQELYERILDLEPNRQNRQLIERVREVVQATEVGEDTTAEEWIEVDDSSLNWGGRIHVDYANWLNDSDFGGQPNYVEFRRLRLFAAGEGYGVYDYQLDLAFAPEFDEEGAFGEGQSLFQGSSIELKDAFVGVRDIPLLGYVRIGHMRTPFSLERFTSSNFLTFLERGHPNRLAPGRELGIAAFNHTANEDITWGYGVYFDELPEADPNIEDDNQGVRVIARATWTPWYDQPSGGRYLLHTGLSGAYTRPRARDNPDLPGTLFRPIRFNARPEIHRGDNLIDTGIIDAQEYQVLQPELALVRGPLSLQSELSWLNIDEISGTSTDIYAAYAYVSYFLTGEHRQYDRRQGRFERVIPYENFWVVRTPRGVRRGWGAWEVAARWSYLEFPDHAAQELQDLTVGINWYWNPRTRVMINWIHPWARNSPESALEHAHGDVLAMRMQVEF